MNKVAAKKRLATLVDLKSLPQNEARVAIAQDVLAALALDKFSSIRGYFTGKLVKVPMQTNLSLREQLPNIPQCDVCALGGLFIAQVARDNDFDAIVYNGAIELGGCDIEDHLTRYFDEEQLDLIEAWFEIWSSAGDMSDTWIRTPRLFRMQRIMENIVQNNGTFVPELL